MGTVILTKKRKQHLSQGDDASTAEATPSRVRRGEHVRHDEQAAHRMVDLELGRLRLKTWSKCGFSIAETLATYLYIHLQGGRRAGARLGSAHAHNDQGCRQIKTVNATQ